MSVVCAYITASNRRWIDQFWNWHESEIPPSQFYFSKSCQEKLENVFCCCTNLELSTFEFRLALWFDFWKLLEFSRNWWNWKDFIRKKFNFTKIVPRFPLINFTFLYSPDLLELCHHKIWDHHNKREKREFKPQLSCLDIVNLAKNPIIWFLK